MYANQPDLVSKHEKYLDMIGWAELHPNTPITPTTACNINTGIVPVDGTEKNLSVQIYVYDVLLLGHSKWQIMMKLAALIEAIFIVMGEPDTAVRQCPLAMDKWEELVVGPVQTMLGLVIDTYQLTVSIPSNYVDKVLLLLNNTWHCGQKQFTVSKAQKLTGKLGHLVQGVTWIFHLLSHLYASIACALSKNTRLLFKSLREFRDIVNSLRNGTYLGANTNEMRHISFAMKRAVKLIHHAKYRYNINKTMHQEINFFRTKIQSLSGITWETPIATLYHECPWLQPLGIAAWKVRGGTQLVWVTGGICLFQKK